MSSYISAADKLALAQPFYNIHDTFKVPIVMYKDAQQVVISTNPQHNAMFPGAPFNDTLQNVTQSGVFNARIKYMAKEDLDFFNTTTRGKGEDQNTLKIEMGMVRLKLDVTGSAYLSDATRVVFDGDVFEPMTSKRPHGLFVRDFDTWYLKKIN